MQTLRYSISINGSPQEVWETMLDRESYVQWVSAGWPGSGPFEGEWKAGADLRFQGEEGGGTLATILDFEPHSFVRAEHVALLGADGVDDRESDFAKQWIGTQESYALTPDDGSTILTVEIVTNPEWASMFDDGWPKALAALKSLVENNT